MATLAGTLFGGETLSFRPAGSAKHRRPARDKGARDAVVGWTASFALGSAMWLAIGVTAARLIG